MTNLNLQQEIGELIVDLISIRLSKLGDAFSSELINRDWSCQNAKKEAYKNLDIYRDTFSDLIDNVKNKIDKISRQHEELAEKEIEQEKIQTTTISSKRRTQSEPRE